MRALHLGVLVILADNKSDLYGRVWIKIDKLKADILRIRKTQPRVDADANVLSWLMDGEGIDLGIFVVGFFRLHHKAAARQLTKDAGPPAFYVKYQDL